MTITEAQKKTMAEFVAEVNGGDAEEYFPENSGIEFVASADPLSSFVPGEWVESSQDGFLARYFEAAQTHKGEARFHLWVIDFGDIRLSCRR